MSLLQSEKRDLVPVPNHWDRLGSYLLSLTYECQISSFKYSNITYCSVCGYTKYLWCWSQCPHVREKKTSLKALVSFATFDGGDLHISEHPVPFFKKNKKQPMFEYRKTAQAHISEGKFPCNKIESRQLKNCVLWFEYWNTRQMQSSSVWSSTKVIHVQCWDKSHKRLEMRSFKMLNSVKLSVLYANTRKDHLLC